MSPSSTTASTRSKPKSPAARPASTPKTESGAALSGATMAAGFQACDVVNDSIGHVIEELKRRQSAIDHVQPALNEAATKRYAELLKESASVRGKSKLYFDYVGSGMGNGPYVELEDGSVKIDMICGIGTMFFGHSDPEIVRTAMKAATGDIIMQGNLQANDDATQFIRTLLKQAQKGKSRLEHVFITNSGCMANESALKICYQKNAPAGRVLAFSNCFAGRSVTMSQIGDSAANRQGVPLSTLVDYMPFYDETLGQEASISRAAEQLRRYIERYPHQHACFIFELVQGEGGFNTAPREFFTTLMDICKANGIAIWVDEVQTFGRTLEMFAFQMLDLAPYVDVVTIGKLSQVCACLYTGDFNPKPGLLSGTFIGSTAALNVGNYMMSTLAAGDYYGRSGRIARHHERFVEGIRQLAKKHPRCFTPIIDPETGKADNRFDIVGGVGGMMRFTPFSGVRDKVMKLLYTLFDEGVIAFYCGHGPHHLRFLPPLGVMKMETWDEVFQVLDRAIAKVE